MKLQKFFPKSSLNKRCFFPVVFVFLASCFFFSGLAFAAKDPKKGESATATTKEETKKPVATPQKDRASEKIQKLQKQIKKLLHDVQTLKQKAEEEELAKLRQEGMGEALSGEKTKEGRTIFRSGQRSLQLLNPELSVTFDSLVQGFFAEGGHHPTNPNLRSGFNFRMAGVHMQANLDPFSLTKIAFAVTPKGVGFGEAYIVWNNVFPSVSVTLGAFRQTFGLVNRWHMPSLDQTFYPLALMTIFGPGGLRQTGLSINWLMPKLWAHANELTIQITNGENGKVFSGAFFSIPTALMRLKNYYDLSESSYIDIGLTGMFGFNNAFGKPTGQEDKKLEDEDLRKTILAAVDITFKWNPLKQQRYKEFLWRTEFYFGQKEVPSQKKAGEILNTTAMGGYSYIQYRFNEAFIAGFIFEIAQPFAQEIGKMMTWQLSPYISFWQSPWVRMRLSYYMKMPPTQKAEHSVFLQFVWSAGPHKHERY